MEVKVKMSVTTEEIHELAAKARLKITQEEMLDIANYMNSFLAEMERMNEIELGSVPFFSFAEADSCSMRDDIVVKYPHRDDIFAAAPVSEGNYYRAPRILEE